MNDDRLDIPVCALSQDMYRKSVGTIAFAHFFLAAQRNQDSRTVEESNT